MTELSDNKCENIPLVTIITPTYNSNKEYLFEAVASVLQQTYPKIEYIITDDGSQYFPEDELREFLEDNAGENIVSWNILKHEINVGTVKNVNGALRVARGEYIFGIAHDDVYYDEKVIEEWVEIFQKTGFKIITGIRSTKNLQTGSEEYLPTQKQRELIRSLTPQRLFIRILQENIISGASTAYDKYIFKQYGVYDEKYKLIEDWPYYLEILSRGEKIGMWERPVIHYRLGGISQNILSSQLETDFFNTGYKYHQVLKTMPLRNYTDIFRYCFAWAKSYLLMNLMISMRFENYYEKNTTPKSSKISDYIFIFLYKCKIGINKIHNRRLT